MLIDECYWVGEIRKPHGLKGEVKAYFDVDYLKEYIDIESVYLLKEDKLTPFFISNINPVSPNLAILKLRDIHTREDAEALHKLEMYLPLDMLPELEEGQFFYHSITGFTVEDQNLGSLGTVKEVQKMPANDILIMHFKGVEVMIPITDHIVVKADPDNKKIITNLPEGLLEVYI